MASYQGCTERADDQRESRLSGEPRFFLTKKKTKCKPPKRGETLSEGKSFFCRTEKINYNEVIIWERSGEDQRSSKGAQELSGGLCKRPKGVERSENGDPVRI